MTPPTPCQKCKAERDALRVALRVAIARLNDFLLAFEGDPEPSENDTKKLVGELQGVLRD